MAEKNDTAVDDGSSRKHNSKHKLSFITSFFLFVAFVFLILVEIGSTSPRLASIYFLRLNLSQIVPTSIPNAVLLNTIAQTLGLHDIYQVGLWNYCQRNLGESGSTECFKPEPLYWFDPVSIIINELLAGASIAIPTEVITYLRILRLASHAMFGFFMTALILCFIAAFMVPFLNRRVGLFLASITTMLACLCTILGSTIATGIFTILSKAATSYPDLNIQAEVGKVMLGFMWSASISTLVALLLQASWCCCCRRRRKGI